MSIDAAPPSADRLTSREAELVALLMHGLTRNADLARALTIADHTVHYHLGGVYRKLGCSNRTEVVSFAFRSGSVVGNRWVPQ